MIIHLTVKNNQFESMFPANKNKTKQLLLHIKIYLCQQYY